MSEQTFDNLTPNQRIDERIASLPDWRGAMLKRVRDLIHEAVPDVVARRHPVHRRNIQGRGEADLCQGGGDR